MTICSALYRVRLLLAVSQILSKASRMKEEWEVGIILTTELDNMTNRYLWGVVQVITADVILCRRGSAENSTWNGDEMEK